MSGELNCDLGSVFAIFPKVDVDAVAGCDNGSAIYVTEDGS